MNWHLDRGQRIILLGERYNNSSQQTRLLNIHRQNISQSIWCVILAGHALFSTCFPVSSRLSMIDGGTSFSHWLCPQSDNGQIKAVLIIHNGFAGCTSHSRFYAKWGVLPHSGPEMWKQLKKQEVMWLPFKIALMLHIEQTETNMLACKPLSPSPSIKKCFV